MFQLAENLHKTLGEIEEMPFEEYLGWVAFYKIKEERAKANGK